VKCPKNVRLFRENESYGGKFDGFMCELMDKEYMHLKWMQKLPMLSKLFRKLIKELKKEY